MILELQNVTKEYARRRLSLFQTPALIKAVNSVSFSINKGESVGLVGESGSGKSTLAKLVMKIESPTSGHILVNGKPIRKKQISDFELFKQIQLVLQDSSSSLYPGMCVQELLKEPLQNFSQEKKREYASACIELLKQVGLDQSFLFKYPQDLSGGQKQRVCIAKALAVQPELIIFDESIASLDSSSQTAIITMLKRIQKQSQISFLFVTHDLRSAQQLCDRVMVMYQGEIVETVKIRSGQKPAHPYARLLFQSIAPALNEMK